MAQHDYDFQPEGAKLKIKMSSKGEVEIVGNRPGLIGLANICAALSECVGEPGNHWHLMDVEGFWGTEPGSVPLIIYGEEL